jgi:hypothetical protein
MAVMTARSAGLAPYLFSSDVEAAVRFLETVPPTAALARRASRA